MNFLVTFKNRLNGMFGGGSSSVKNNVNVVTTSQQIVPASQQPLTVSQQLATASSQPFTATDNPAARRQKQGYAKKSKYQATLRHAAEIYIEVASPSTQRNYLTALRSIATFNGGEDVTLAQLREPFIIRFERWLCDRGICLNTSSCYMRSLRALYNKVVKQQRLRDQRPFAHVYTGVAKTDLPVLDRKDICRLRSVELKPGSRQEMARDLFLFSLCSMGMPFVDVAFMRKSQIEGDTLVYHRHKTGQRVSVYLEPCMQQIIRKYWCEDGDYVFPILRSTAPQNAYAEYKSGLAAYNAQLSQLEKKAGLSKHLSSYTPRRTWASLAYQRNVEVETISQALGHTNSRTTRTYIKTKNDKKLRKTNKELLNYLSLQTLG